jgi:phospholipid transport system substrate-binding protein
MNLALLKTWAIAAVTVLTLSSVAAPAQAELIRDDNPYLLLEKVANKTFDRIGTDRELISANLDHLRVIIREEMMPYVDWVYASKRVLGRALQNTTAEQRQEFYAVFRDYLIATYGRAFTAYDESKHTVEFGDARRFDGNSRMVEVNTRVVEAGTGRPPIRMDFKMRYDNDDKIWKAYDLVVEGVSLLNSKQAEVAQVIRQRGIDGTIVLLREKAAEPIRQYQAGDDTL